MEHKPALERVAILGAGAVGASFAYAMVLEGRAREIVLVDVNRRKAEGHVMDLAHCLPYSRPMSVRVGDLDDAAGCGLVVITAGVAQQPGETRLDLMKRNADIMATFFPRLSDANPGAIFVVITNPVDVMTRLAIRLAARPGARIFGTGTTLDSARFRTILSDELRVDPRNVHAYVIGEHGDSEVLAWSRAMIGPYTVEEFAARTGRPFDAAFRERVAHGVRTAAYQIIERKGATSFAIGISMRRVFDSLENDLRTIQTVSRDPEGAHGLRGVCLSLPCAVHAAGADRPLELPLAPEEESALRRSADVLDAAYQSLGA